jgi:hypothetical protein
MRRVWRRRENDPRKFYLFGLHVTIVQETAPGDPVGPRLLHPGFSTEVTALPIPWAFSAVLVVNRCMAWTMVPVHPVW